MTETKTEQSAHILSNIVRNRLLKYSEDKKISIMEAKEVLAKHMDCEVKLVTRWMNNSAQPTLLQAILIAKFLSLPVESVFTIHNA